MGNVHGTTGNNGRWEMFMALQEIMGDGKCSQSFFRWNQKERDKQTDQLWRLEVQKCSIKFDLEGKEWDWTGLIWIHLGTTIGYLWMWSSFLCFHNTRWTAAVASNVGHTHRYRGVWWCVIGLVATDVSNARVLVLSMVRKLHELLDT